MRLGPIGNLRRAVATALSAMMMALRTSTAVEPPELPTGEELTQLPADGGPLYNRLVFESSVYLRQHATNPIDWYPWGDEAFERARAEDKPIFLSIGYSTCHWCHVMERESFASPEVATLLNEHFVSIKVDREERPDIDEVYMAASIATRRGGGWPQSVFMTADKRPFHMASYIPKTSEPNRLGMLDLLPEIVRVWDTNRAGIYAAADEAIENLRRLNGSAKGDVLDDTVLRVAFEELSKQYDSTFGGFTAPAKFPPTHHLSFLLRYGRRTGDAKAIAMVENTLVHMRRGGIFDQIGYGFHRYTTDPEWNVPHFEKMLCDQAMLAMAYVEAFQATGRSSFGDVAREICEYVLGDLGSPVGAFYAARDADSEGREGKFYTWSVGEVMEVLGRDRGAEFIHAYNFEAQGNYDDQATGTRTGFNVPHLSGSLPTLAEEMGIETELLRSRLESSRKLLFERRETRTPPMREEAVLTDWNALMIVALAKCGQALNEPRYVSAAKTAADFLLIKLTEPGGSLFHRYCDGKASSPAHLADYAYVVWALFEVYEATYETRYLKTAIAFNDTMIDRFWDEQDGGFFSTAHDGEAMVARIKEAYDRALPSGNSVAALNLMRIAHVTGDPRYESRAQSLFRAFAQRVRQSPSAFTQLLIALDMAIGPTFEVVVAGRSGAPDTEAMFEALRTAWSPNKVVLFRPDRDGSEDLTEIAPFTAVQKPIDGKATAYVCQDRVCNAPTTKVTEMLNALRAK